MAKKAPAKKTGRKLLDIDPQMVETLAEMQCTMEEIGAVVGCDRTTVAKRFSQEIAKGQAAGRMSLRRAQWEAVKKGNVVAMIWLGKQYLGQSDKVEQKIDAKVQEERKALDMKDIERFLAAKHKAGLNGGKPKTHQNVGMRN